MVCFYYRVFLIIIVTSLLFCFWNRVLFNQLQNFKRGWTDLLFIFLYSQGSVKLFVLFAPEESPHQNLSMQWSKPEHWNQLSIKLSSLQRACLSLSLVIFLSLFVSVNVKTYKIKVKASNPNKYTPDGVFLKCFNVNTVFQMCVNLWRSDSYSTLLELQLDY